MNSTREVLLVEDDPDDVFLFKRALTNAGVTLPLSVATDGQHAMDLLSSREKEANDLLPALIVLDLKMPRRNGMEVLKWIRDHPALRCLPVFIFSSSAHRDDVERAYSIGANGFMVKPSATSERTEFVRFIHQWITINRVPLAVTTGFKAAAASRAITTSLEGTPVSAASLDQSR